MRLVYILIDKLNMTSLFEMAFSRQDVKNKVIDFNMFTFSFKCFIISYLIFKRRYSNALLRDQSKWQIS